MAQASNQVMAEYLRSTRTLLSQMAGYTPEQIESFIDDTFSSYIRLMAQNQQKQCPSLFYQRLVGEGALETLPKERVAFLSGMMAITMCAILDKLGRTNLALNRMISGEGPFWRRVLSPLPPSLLSPNLFNEWEATRREFRWAAFFFGIGIRRITHCPTMGVGGSRVFFQKVHRVHSR